MFSGRIRSSSRLHDHLWKQPETDGEKGVGASEGKDLGATYRGAEEDVNGTHAWLYW